MGARSRKLPSAQTAPAARHHIAGLNLQRIGLVHLAVTFAFYSLFLGTAAINQTLWIPGGIGVFQNPPFFGHLLITTVSIPLVIALITRIRRSLADTPTTEADFVTLIERSRAARVVYGWAITVGLFSLAAAIVYASSYQMNIYDAAMRYPATFASYSLVRVYQYVVCYPVLVTVPLCSAILFFRALRSGSVRYDPFAKDEMGGLRKYLRAVDVPIYAVQSLCALLLIANYVGWGAFTLIPSLVAVGSLVVATLMGLALHGSFRGLIEALRREEMARVRQHQAAMYELYLHQDGKTQQAKAIVEELEAGERLIEIIRKRKNLGWLKYGINFAVALTPPLVKLVLFPG